MSSKSPYAIKDEILIRYVTDSRHAFETILITQCLTGYIMKKACDEWDHNECEWTYSLLCTLY